MAATTTPTAIAAALKTLIEGLTPKGGTTVGIESSFAQRADDFDEVPEATWADRQFWIEGLLPTAVDDFCGVISQVDYASTFELIIDHVIGPRNASRDRRNEDTHQLIDQLQRKPAFSSITGVSQIKFEGSTLETSDDDDFWRTVLTFTIHYSIASNYGG